MVESVIGPSGRKYTLNGPKNDHQVRHWQAGHFYEYGNNGVLNWAYQHPAWFVRVIDLGACLGNHAVFFAGELGADVVAVEPMWSTYAKLNARANYLSHKIRVVRSLIGMSRLYKCIEPPKNNAGMARFEPASDLEGGLIMVGQSLSVLVDDFAPTCIKVDCEGMEEEVVRASLDVITEHHPLLIIETDDTATIDALLPNHTRLPIAFNATPTHVYKPKRF